MNNSLIPYPSVSELLRSPSGDHGALGLHLQPHHPARRSPVITDSGEVTHEQARINYVANCVKYQTRWIARHTLKSYAANYERMEGVHISFYEYRDITYQLWLVDGRLERHVVNEVYL